jgi:hypothetical protein
MSKMLLRRVKNLHDQDDLSHRKQRVLRQDVPFDIVMRVVHVM